MPSAEIITIGTEILLGEIVDTNTRYLARTLRGLGIDLYRTTTIGDNLERIAATVREALQRADIILTTGGLGPTVDDPTRQAIARAVGVETEFRPELWEQIVATIARYGRTPTENQKRQAYLPRGAIAIPNPVGTAPAFIVEINTNNNPTALKAIISLPGVPKEMEYLLHQSVIPYLQRRFDLRHIIKVRVLHTSGAGEGMIDDQIGDLETLPNPTVGLAAHNGVVDIRITAKAESEPEADRLIAEVENQIRQRLGHIIFGSDDDTLEAVTLAAVERRGWRPLQILAHGIEDSLFRLLPPPASLPDLEPGALPERVRAAHRRNPASAALGIAVFPQHMSMEISLVTPQGEKNHRFTYGGHPRNLPRWALNTALNLLRLHAEGIEK
jgi:competence/damage-inducible protein CinA-like protein